MSHFHIKSFYPPLWQAYRHLLSSRSFHPASWLKSTQCDEHSAQKWPKFISE